MRIKSYLISAAAIVLLALTFLLPAPMEAQDGRPAQDFRAISATGKTDWFNVSRFGSWPSEHTIHFVKSGTVSTCTVKLEGTTLGPSDSPGDSEAIDLTGDITCTSNVAVHVVNKRVRMVRVNVTAISGGGSIRPRYGWGN